MVRAALSHQNKTCFKPESRIGQLRYKQRQLCVHTAPHHVPLQTASRGHRVKTDGIHLMLRRTSAVKTAVTAQEAYPAPVTRDTASGALIGNAGNHLRSAKYGNFSFSSHVWWAQPAALAPEQNSEGAGPPWNSSAPRHADTQPTAPGPRSNSAQPPCFPLTSFTARRPTGGSQQPLGPLFVPTPRAARRAARTPAPQVWRRARSSALRTGAQVRPLRPVPHQSRPREPPAPPRLGPRHRAPPLAALPSPPGPAAPAAQRRRPGPARLTARSPPPPLGAARPVRAGTAASAPPAPLTWGAPAPGAARPLAAPRAIPPRERARPPRAHAHAAHAPPTPSCPTGTAGARRGGAAARRRWRSRPVV